MRPTPACFILLVVVVLTAVFACYRQPADEVSGWPGASRQAVKNSLCADERKRPRVGNFVPLSQSAIDGVDKFVLFVGYQRSAHSIISSMMDAHPNMVISRGYYLVPRCVNSTRGPLPKNKNAIFNALYMRSYRKAARLGCGTEKNTSKGYNLHVHTPWQGSFTHLRVIGDKGGGAMATIFSKYYQKAKMCLQLIMNIVRVPLIVFHVVRNPFDMIATGLFHTSDTNQYNMRADDLTVLKPDDNHVKAYADMIFRKATAVTRVMELMKVVEIHAEDLVADPRKTVRGICSTLNLPCPEQYVEACYEKTYRNASKSRYNMEWSPNMLQYIESNMKNYSFFSRYLFNL